jgi:hypothetical protein
MQTWVKLGVAGIAWVLSACSGIVKDDPPIEPDDSVAIDQAIVHGALDRGRHPSVVALFADEGDLHFMCSAFVIAPDVLLTARHCVARLQAETISCPPRTPQVGSPLAAASLSVHLGDDVRSSEPVAFGRSIHAPYTDALCDADIAVVTIDRPLRVRPLPLRRSSRARVGGTITAVGYGRIGASGQQGLRRFRAHVPIVEASPTELVVGESTCSGDSGGPAIDEASGEVVGVLSRGSRECARDTSRNVYTQVLPYLDLIDRILGYSGGAPATQPIAEPPTDVGESCVSGETCASGICAEPGPAGYCSRPCGPDLARCPNGYRCARKTSESAGVCARRVPG